MKTIVLSLLFILCISCGKTSSQNIDLISTSIINGEVVESDDPVERATVQIGHCSGTLISENLVVTAAHCVSNGYLKYRGSRGYRHPSVRLDRSSPEIEIESSDVDVHPNFKKREDHNDLALVKLSKPVRSAPYKPVAILDSSYQLNVNSELVIAGFGLQCAENCDVYYSGYLRKRKAPFVRYDKLDLILKQVNGLEGAYFGDSGGPAYLVTANELLLVGATTGSTGENATEQKPMGENVFYVDIAKYKDFILKTAKKMKATLPVFKTPKNN